MLIYGTEGREVKVHYRGQRGEGVYDVAFEGLIKNVERRYKETFSEASKAEYESFMRITPCKSCKGQRLKPSAWRLRWRIKISMRSPPCPWAICRNF